MRAMTWTDKCFFIAVFLNYFWAASQFFLWKKTNDIARQGRGGVRCCSVGAPRGAGGLELHRIILSSLTQVLSS